MRLPNSFGGIVYLGKRRRKPWAARKTVGYTDSGKQKYKYIGYYAKRSDALSALVDYNSNPYDLTAKMLTFAEIFDVVMKRKSTEISVSSQKNYKIAFNKCADIHNMPISEIKAHHLQKIFDDNAGKSISKVAKIIINHIFAYAIKHEMITKDYSKIVDAPVVKVKKRKTTFTPEEIKILKDNIHVPYVDVILILLYTGMRISELLDMKKENVFINDRYMIGGNKTDAGMNRFIPLHNDIIPLIQARYDSSDIYLVQSIRNGKLNYENFRRVIYLPLIETLNISNHTIHETRHTFISQCDRLELPQQSVKRIVGHSNGNDITAHYTHKTIADLVCVIDRFHY